MEFTHPNESALRAAINSAEKNFGECRDILESESFERGAILGFQPKLARAIYALEVQILAVKRARRALVEKKREYSKADLALKFQELKGFVGALERVIDVGLLLGDSFAWMFYRQSPRLLRRHYQHQRLRHLPVSLGGRGEISFIETHAVIGHHLVLYHGVTTFLRIGDISLVNLQTGKIDGIGELKTTQVEEDRCEINLNYIGGKIELPASFSLSAVSKAPPLPPKLAAKLASQLREIKRAVVPEQKSSPRIDMRNQTLVFAPERLAELYDQADDKKSSALRLSPGLVVIGIKTAGHTLAERVLDSDPNFKSALDRIPDDVRGLVVPGAPDNSLKIGTLVFPGGGRYYLTYGMKPLRWWPLRQDVREAIASGRFLVLTVFNPASLLARFREHGFVTKAARPGVGFSIHLEKGARPLVFGPLDHFLELIPQRMIQEESVFNMICLAVARLDAQHPEPEAKIHLELNFESLEEGESPSSDW